MAEAEFDRLRSDAALLRAIISRRVKLKRSGGQWKGLCPFHVEDTPSFTVFEDGHFYCFGCQAHGSVFDYIMKSEGIGFREARDRVATESSIVAPNGTGKQKDKGNCPGSRLPRIGGLRV